eukprot:TRINITY_DN6163_c0_g1_i1.p2 TRINITY_DN6163_c0_g1~~TRINITY_DN6163_c0_g1_i1.p2  ORF type:complete len:125 (-),score=35.71 TRINITY_DN6163_c0_g1_i1:177-551(-)
MRELQVMAPPGIVAAIMGNKTDLPPSLHFNTTQCSQYAESVGATHNLTSAKLDDGVEEVFISICRRLLAKKPTSSSGGSGINAAASEASAATTAAMATQSQKKLILMTGGTRTPPVRNSSNCCN